MNLNKRVITLGLVVFLTACGTSEKRVDNLSENSVNVAPEITADLSYKVRPGDFLSQIAQKTTGNGENWREIARYNDIKNPNKLKKNETLLIPGHLLPVDNSAKTAIVAAAAPVEKKPAEVAKKPVKKAEETEKPRDNSEWVMVEGSYYPKAIYRKPNYSAGMLTRVLPGTTLKHVQSGENWIQVETEKGLGYLHRSDAHRLNKNELSLKASSEF